MWFLIIVFLVGILIGMVVGVPVTLYLYKAGTLIIDQSDEIVDKYSFEIDKDLGKLPNEEYISMKIKVVNERPEAKQFLDEPDDVKVQ